MSEEIASPIQVLWSTFARIFPFLERHEFFGFARTV